NPLREDISSGNDSSWLNENWIDGTFTIPTKRRIPTIPAIQPGRFFTSFPTLPQKRCFCFASLSNFGMDGQKARRPSNANILGINVNPVIAMHTIAIENTGTDARYGSNIVTNNVSIAKKIVPPLRNIDSDT